jgi:septal ring factor EnvC (AmiA/AmiB activator)
MGEKDSFRSDTNYKPHSDNEIYMMKGIASRLSRISIIPVIMLFCITPAHLEAASHTGSGEKREQAKKIESQLFSQKGKLRTVYSQEKDLLAELDVLEKDVEEKRRSVAKLKKMIRLAANEVKGLQGELGETQRASRNAESRLAHKMISLYKYARKGYVRLLADVRDVDQFRRRVKYLKVIVREDRRELARLAQDVSRQQSEVLQAEKVLFQKKEMIDEKKHRLLYFKKELEKKTIRLIKIQKYN